MITELQIKRINELARLSKQRALSDEEKSEQSELRRLYIDSMKASLVSNLENTYIIDKNGNKKRLQKRK